MSGIGSLLRSRWLEVAWAAFAALNVFVMVLWPRWETVPFHFVWVSVTLLYGLAVWSVRNTAVVLAVIMLATGAAIVRDTIEFHENADEITEVPLMAAMFVAMVWHARRHRAAVNEVQRLAEREHTMRERERTFVRNASHELRTPITVARGHAELAAGQQTDVTSAEDLAIVIDELDRLSTLSSRLLLLAAADSPDFLSSCTVDVAELVEGVVRRWAPTTPRDWRAEVTRPATAVVDAARVEAAVDALIENAVAFTSSGARICLSVGVSGEGVTVDVADTGVGIAPDDLTRVFEPFARGGYGRDQRTGGTGLGLALVRAVVQAHGGAVAIRSTLGMGTVVTLTFPAGPPAPDGAESRLDAVDFGVEVDAAT
jgi:signal transduction histidine kinase